MRANTSQSALRAVRHSGSLTEPTCRQAPERNGTAGAGRPGGAQRRAGPRESLAWREKGSGSSGASRFRWAGLEGAKSPDTGRGRSERRGLDRGRAGDRAWATKGKGALGKHRKGKVGDEVLRLTFPRPIALWAMTEQQRKQSRRRGSHRASWVHLGEPAGSGLWWAGEQMVRLLPSHRPLSVGSALRLSPPGASSEVQEYGSGLWWPQGARAGSHRLDKLLEDHALDKGVREQQEVRQAVVPGLEGTAACAVLLKAVRHGVEQPRRPVPEGADLEPGVPEVADIGLVREERVHHDGVGGDLAEEVVRGREGGAPELPPVELEQHRRDLLQEDGVVSLEGLEDVVVRAQLPEAVDRCVAVPAAGLAAGVEAARREGRRVSLEA
eukprot:CAMPEP_0177580278 /NCGR_PEP_ID=MMETSP0419_2-20121207/1468_1 /TAXON_ID=582737 /ORGANISM="Tetraselmis sp., Strain GSL018" /LENGTH=382 /DNA_ID=CAMNT_0019069121 /DNA_START=432 /DNA_END=1578 /DNA_ORIENTATION=+